MAIRTTIPTVKNATLGLLVAVLLAGLTATGAQADGTAQDETFDIFQSRMNQQNVTRRAPPPQTYVAPAPVMAPQQQGQHQAQPQPQQRSAQQAQQQRTVQRSAMPNDASPSVYDPYEGQRDFLAIDPVWAAVSTGLLFVVGLVLIL
ncbi:MAG: hypothetical protein ABF335_00630 [Alphaproteobacteria bacterium]